MYKYQTLLFDLDDTLLDFGAAEKMAFRSLLQSQNVEHSDEKEARYKEINKGLWKKFEEGALTRNEVIHTRFVQFFGEQSIEVDGVEMDRQFRHFLEEGKFFVEGAEEVISTLHHTHDLYIVTNGVSTTQAKRLKATGLRPYFTTVFVSEDTGFQKPMKGFFDYVFARIPNFDSSRTIIIGDSLSADIRGGNDAGIATCWFNPRGLTNETGIEPTYEIRQLDELYAIVGENENE
ncbi:YjjG family noncanonical pyrimidine nucleotidase [Paenisporosarcina cavernae]|uniref:Noncanonical pyrimidine nucleotidase, YjjG family n=1 Tax=Paenisporosarcina cavernae TaxID=2320858 RepID=A0A385YY97_9BACL|nr:YjjG family noncanonical pyrimidine nucleotidase [Paenisporosarcina cavernae]AYC30503.1 noncanonical pyrimidine nucleotidase, YjjG family [Paenisporosarcina cavernae]